jgi:hypothetical protein
VAEQGTEAAPRQPPRERVEVIGGSRDESRWSGHIPVLSIPERTSGFPTPSPPSAPAWSRRHLDEHTRRLRAAEPVNYRVEGEEDGSEESEEPLNLGVHSPRRAEATVRALSAAAPVPQARPGLGDGLSWLPITGWAGALSRNEVRTCHFFPGDDGGDWQPIRRPLERKSTIRVDWGLMKNRDAELKRKRCQLEISLYEIFNSTESSVLLYLDMLKVTERVRLGVTGMMLLENRVRNGLITPVYASCRRCRRLVPNDYCQSVATQTESCDFPALPVTPVEEPAVETGVGRKRRRSS